VLQIRVTGAKLPERVVERWELADGGSSLIEMAPTKLTWYRRLPAHP